MSSRNLALKWLEKEPMAPAEPAVVVLNHLDCDSVLSGGIVAGRLPPLSLFGEAAIAADHTGAENNIAICSRVSTPNRPDVESATWSCARTSRTT